MTTHVRGLTRGLSLLVALSELKFANPAALARQTGLPRATVYRLLDTLSAEGYVVRMADSDLFRMTSAVTKLLGGFDDETRFIEAAEHVVDALGEEVLWPIDLFTYGPGRPMIRQSTHGKSPLSFFAAPTIGKCVSMLGSSPGRAYLASMSEAELSETLAREVNASENRPSAREVAQLRWMLGDMRQRGYGYRDGGTLPRTCSIAVPVMHHDRLIGSISVMFMRRAMPLEKARERYLPGIRRAAAAIEKTLAAG